MTTKTFIERRSFELLGDLYDEEDVLEEFLEYDSGYICDVISEIADKSVPIYSADIWKNVSDISEYIEEAIEEGIAPVDKNVDLLRIFQSGYYVYYNKSLYNNVYQLIYNYIADKVDEYLMSGNVDTDSIDIDQIEEAIGDFAEEFDNNNRMEYLWDSINEIIDNIKDGQFNI